MHIDYWILLLTTISRVSSYDDLSLQKVATQSTTYTGTSDLYKASNAVDRNITTCMRTEQIGATSPYTSVWWKVDLGGVYNIYSVNILFKNYDGYEMRQRGRFAGFSLYVSNSNENGETKFLCYKDGPQLPLINFTTACATSGRYIEFTNNRLDGVTYPRGFEVSNVITELCEVIVYGCYRDGVYGQGCHIPCPDNCKTNTCHIQNGTCFECKPGWMESTCNKPCVYGWYGLDCKQSCPGHCRENITCNHVTGLCDGGCAAGWNGSLCNEPCLNELFGVYCSQRCSGNCKDNVSCNHVTGLCDGGCAAGWSGSRCDRAMPSNLESQLCAQYYGPWSVAGPVSLGFNICFIVGLLFFFWSVYTKRISMSLPKLPCVKSNLYVETEVKTEDNSHYQEIGLSGEGNQYQNTTLQ